MEERNCEDPHSTVSTRNTTSTVDNLMRSVGSCIPRNCVSLTVHDNSAEKVKQSFVFCVFAQFTLRGALQVVRKPAVGRDSLRAGTAGWAADCKVSCTARRTWTQQFAFFPVPCKKKECRYKHFQYRYDSWELVFHVSNSV